MQIKDMFERDINRNINGVIKIGQHDDETIEQELSEYVMTNELREHFATFFDAYERSLDNPTGKMGVWISGFFGSGKSHFLKMLSYLLSNRSVRGKHAIDYLEPRFEDPMVAAKVRRAVSVPTETILFNIDSKGPSAKDDTAILKVFARVFFEHLGFYGEDIKLARLEQFIDNKGKTREFRNAYRGVTGDEWLETRSMYDFNRDEVIDALEECGAMSRAAAEGWFDNSENFEFSIEWLVGEIKSYVEGKLEQHNGQFRLLFMIDEVGQYITGSQNQTSLMLNLQTLVEDLGVACADHVWVVVTSQEAIDEVTSVAGQDFSKIQGRFNTRLSLSSTGAGEVIRRRILAKNEHASQLLNLQYTENATVLKNLFTFKDAQNDLGGYAGAESYVDAFPFVGYQFKLMQGVINGLRNQGSSGKHLSAERSMLSGFQEVAQRVEDRNEHALVPLWMFYDTVSSFLEGYHRRVIDRAAVAARDCAGLEEYDVRVLKLLFLIKWVDREMPGNVDNIVTLMVDNLGTNRAELRQPVQESLDRLVKQNYIARSGERYLFLTDEQQEIARQIARTPVDLGKLTKKTSDIVFGQIFENDKLTLGKNNFPVQEYLDGMRHNNMPSGLILRVIAGVDGSGAPEREELLLQSARNEAIVLPSSEYNFYAPLEEAARIEGYINSIVVGNLPESQREIIRSKQQEKTALERRAKGLIEEAIRHGEFYAGGTQITPSSTTSVKKLMEECVGKLVNSVYPNLGQIDKNYDNDAELKAILAGTARSLDGIEPNKQAIEEVRRYLDVQQQLHRSVTMGDIQRKYAAATFGWREMDIAAVVAELIASGDARITYAERVVAPQDAKMVSYLRQRNMVDNARIEMRAHVSSGELTTARRAIEDLCRVHDLPTAEDALAPRVRQALNERLDGLNGLLSSEYRRNRNYPGYDAVTRAAATIKDLLATPGDGSDLLRAVAKARVELEDTAEDLEDVDEFFPDKQRIFDEASNTVHKLESDRSYLATNSEAVRALEQIERTLSNPNPYREIRDLPDAQQALARAHADLLEAKRMDVSTQAQDIFASIHEHGRELDVTLSLVEQTERARREAINSAGTLTQLDALAARLSSDQTSLFQKLDEEHERIHRPAPAREGVVITAPPSMPKQPERKVKEVRRTLAFKPKNNLSSKEDIDAYLKNARAYLLEQLNGNDAISLK